jgi:hypothetical protein
MKSKRFANELELSFARGSAPLDTSESDPGLDRRVSCNQI